MSIFDDEGNKMTSQYWKYPNVGDKVEGTYVERRVTTNRLKKDAEQIVYSIMLEDGTFTDVYGKPGIDAQMRNVKLGQIIGFEFVREDPPKQAGHSPTKIVQVYANPKTVNEDWIKGINGEATVPQAAGPVTPEQTQAPAEAPVAAPVEPSATADLEALVKEVNDLATAKLGATDPEDVKTKTMEATGLAFIEGNLPQILEALKALPA